MLLVLLAHAARADHTGTPPEGHSAHSGGWGPFDTCGVHSSGYGHWDTATPSDTDTDTDTDADTDTDTDTDADTGAGPDTDGVNLGGSGGGRREQGGCSTAPDAGSAWMLALLLSSGAAARRRKRPDLTGRSPGPRPRTPAAGKPSVVDSCPEDVSVDGVRGLGGFRLAR